jgi:hypothetical protein
MANNRLYIGNKETKEFRCTSKSGDNFRKLTMRDLKLLNEIIITDNAWNKKTDLVLFTESDDELYIYFHNAT